MSLFNYSHGEKPTIRIGSSSRAPQSTDPALPSTTSLNSVKYDAPTGKWFQTRSVDGSNVWVEVMRSSAPANFIVYNSGNGKRFQTQAMQGENSSPVLDGDGIAVLAWGELTDAIDPTVLEDWRLS